MQHLKLLLVHRVLYKSHLLRYNNGQQKAFFCNGFRFFFYSIPPLFNAKHVPLRYSYPIAVHLDQDRKVEEKKAKGNFCLEHISAKVDC